MSISAAKIIENYLEDVFDIPFEVFEGKDRQDVWFTIKPHNEGKELFVLKIKIKNQIRLIIEVIPEEYAGFSIRDMAAASLLKKEMFAEYAKRLKELKAKIDFFINDSACDILNPATWPQNWTGYRLRVTRSPICSDEEQLNEIEVVYTWSTIITGMFLSLLDVELLEDVEYQEGGRKRIEANRYERNPANRELCLSVNGYKCKICDFDFEKTYGEFGRHYIHVHHIEPISNFEEAYVINPVKDLIPVCPNCHAILHRTDPPLLPEELISKIKEQNGLKK